MDNNTSLNSTINTDTEAMLTELSKLPDDQIKKVLDLGLEYQWQVAQIMAEINNRSYSFTCVDPSCNIALDRVDNIRDFSRSIRSHLKDHFFRFSKKNKYSKEEIEKILESEIQKYSYDLSVMCDQCGMFIAKRSYTLNEVMKSLNGHARALDNHTDYSAREILQKLARQRLEQNSTNTQSLLMPASKKRKLNE